MAQPQHRAQWIVVGISGVTCGGKTSLANRLTESIFGATAALHQDDYFYPDNDSHHVKCQNLDHNNYDILSSLDMGRMVSDARRVLASPPRPPAGPPPAPRRDSRGVLTLNGKGILILEGFTVLNYKPLLELCDLRYYFILEYSQCLSRRAMRLYDPPDIEGYFDQCVWPEHLRYRAEIEKDNTVRLLDGTRPDIYDQVVSDLKGLGVTETRH